MNDDEHNPYVEQEKNDPLGALNVLVALSRMAMSVNEEGN